MKEEAKNELVLPMVHLNGTDSKTLFEGYYNAYKAAVELGAAMAKTEFHPRDYYVISDTAWEEAREQRIEINRKLKDIEEYLLALVLHIQHT